MPKTFEQYDVCITLKYIFKSLNKSPLLADLKVNENISGTSIMRCLLCKIIHDIYICILKLACMDCSGAL